MAEYLIEQNGTGRWSSVSIPNHGTALVVSNDGTGHMTTADMSVDSARNLIDWLYSRSANYTVTLQQCDGRIDGI